MAETAKRVREITFLNAHREELKILNQFLPIIMHAAINGDYKVYVGPLTMEERISISTFGYYFEDNLKSKELERLFWICWDKDLEIY